jgi:hypothetical protein
MDAGVSVFVYQVGVNKVQRTLPPADPQHRRPLPLDVVPAGLTNDEVFQLWQVLPNSLQLSAPYVA